MTRKHTRRKIYALVNPIAHAIEGACITPDAKLDKLRVLELSAIEAISKGQGTPADMAAMRDMVNLAETMARGGVGPEALAPTEAAQAELASMVERYNRTGRVGATGPGLELLREAFRWHDVQRASISRSKYEWFIDKTANTMRTGGAGKVLKLDLTHPGVTPQ